MSHSGCLLRRLAAACAFAAVTLPASAVDGVVLIDQNRALAGNVTPGDTAGFPISINQPGSYRLSSNIVVPAGVDGVQINADNVTIDLNGFAILGPGSFPNGLFAAISANDRERVVIADGSISGFVTGIAMRGQARFMRIERLQLDATTRQASGGIVGGLAAVFGTQRASYAVITDVQAIGQIQMSCPGIVRNTVAGIVVTSLPYDGTGTTFPAGCTGDNVVPAPFN